MADCAVIFDVDGVLLELTPAEELLFFQPFARRYGLTRLSHDWDSYRIRNEDDIVAEILETHGLPATDKPAVITDYVTSLKAALQNGTLKSVPVTAAAWLQAKLKPHATLGIATANFLAAATLRLQSCNLWAPVQAHAAGADGGGHKSDILRRAIASTGLPPHNILFIGDNVNDVQAGRENGTHFIGFSTSAERRYRLGAAGARHISADHATTFQLVCDLLRLNIA